MADSKTFSDNISVGVEREQKGSLFRQDMDGYDGYGTKTEVVDLNYHQYLADLRDGRRIIGTAGQAGNYSVLYLGHLEGGNGYECGDYININAVGFMPTSRYGASDKYDEYTPFDEEEK